MKCKMILTVMSEYLDGAMSGHERLDFELHIEKCEPCANELAKMEKILVSIRNLGSQDSPVNCWAVVREQLQNKRHKHSHWYHLFLRPLVAVPALGLPVLAYVILALPAAVEEPRIQPADTVISAPEYSRYLTAHSHAQRTEVLSDPDVSFVAAELEKASLTSDTIK